MTFAERGAEVRTREATVIAPGFAPLSGSSYVDYSRGNLVVGFFEIFFTEEIEKLADPPQW